MIVTHDARIFEFADRIAQMDDGRVTQVTSRRRAAVEVAVLIRQDRQQAKAAEERGEKNKHCHSEGRLRPKNPASTPTAR